VRVWSKGLQVGPGAAMANSVVTVLPRMTAPASRSAKTLAASRPERQSLKIALFIWVGISTVSMMSLIATGQPSTADSGRPWR
jgi:hypothetical protein